MSTCSTYGLTLDQTADQLARHLELETILISPVKINRQDWDMGLPQKTSLTTPKSNEGKILDFQRIFWATHFLLFFEINRDRTLCRVHHTCFCILIWLINSVCILYYAMQTINWTVDFRPEFKKLSSGPDNSWAKSKFDPKKTQDFTSLGIIWISDLGIFFVWWARWVFWVQQF